MRALLSLALVLFAAGCSDSDDGASSSTAGPASSGGAGEKIDLGEGLYVEVLEEGEGSVIQEGVHLDINFELYLQDGNKLVQSTYDMGQPYHYEPGIDDVVPGVQLALIGMRDGTRARVEIPSHLAYGPEGFPDLIPPYADLIMELHIVKVFGPDEPH